MGVAAGGSACGRDHSPSRRLDPGLKLKQKYAIMRPRATPIDQRPFWNRRSILGENISNGNWIVALILLLSGGGALQQGWIIAAIGLGVAGLLSVVWNDGVAKTTTIIGSWIVAGAASAWLLGLLTTSMFGSPAGGHAVGLIIAIAGIVTTID